MRRRKNLKRSIHQEAPEDENHMINLMGELPPISLEDNDGYDHANTNS
jgi:hypothetical protein